MAQCRCAAAGATGARWLLRNAVCMLAAAPLPCAWLECAAPRACGVVWSVRAVVCACVCMCVLMVACVITVDSSRPMQCSGGETHNAQMRAQRNE
jgi:hypothetical protein